MCSFNKKGLSVLNKIILLLVGLSIAGCVGIPLSSVYKMMTANPLEFHPDAISTVIKRSNAIQIETGDIVMNIYINSDNPELRVSEEYFLAVDNTPRVPILIIGVNENEALTVLTLSPDDVIRMKSLQKRMKSHLKNGGKSDDFGFSIFVLRGCKNTNNMPSNVFVSLFLKLDSRSDFFPLYQDFDIAQADLSPLENLEDWDDCSNYSPQ